MQALILFVKHPVPGEVKTRLAAELGTEKAVAIYEALLAHTRDVSLQVASEKVVFYGNALPDMDLWSAAGYARYPQQGKDLGARMDHAFASVFAGGADKALLIGSDCAHIQPHILEQAFACLDKKDVVLGPASDGGYYLIGMRQQFSPVFQGKTWSTDTVLADTVRDLKAAGKSYDFLPTLSDVDTAADLEGTFLQAIVQKV